MLQHIASLRVVLHARGSGEIQIDLDGHLAGDPPQKKSVRKSLQGELCPSR